jgi:hypothetical protein
MSDETPFGDVPDTAPVALVDPCKSEHPLCLTNYQGTPQESWAFMSQALSPGCESIADHIGETFRLRHWLLTQVSLPDSEGVSRPCVKTVLVDDEGRFLWAISGGIYRSVQLLCQTLGGGPYDPPVEVQLCTHKGKQPGAMYYFVPKPVREPASPAKGGKR